MEESFCYDVRDLDSGELIELGEGKGPGAEIKILERVEFPTDTIRQIILADGTTRRIHSISESSGMARSSTCVNYVVTRDKEYTDFVIHGDFQPDYARMMETFLKDRGFTQNHYYEPWDWRETYDEYQFIARFFIGMDNQDQTRIATFVRADRILFGKALASAVFYSRDGLLKFPIGDQAAYVEATYHPNGNMVIPESGLFRRVLDFIQLKYRAITNVLTLPSPKIIVDDKNHFDEMFKEISMDIGELERIEPRKLEQLIAELFSREGWDVHPSITLTRDGGFDGAITKKHEFGMSTYIYECKTKSNGKSIGVNVVRNLNSVVGKTHANGGILCAASKISRDATIEAEQHYKLLYLQDVSALHARIRAIRGNQ